jgi:hypothetical protein
MCFRNMRKIAASTAKRMNWIAIEWPAYQSTISGACRGTMYLRPNSSNSIRAVFANSRAATIHKANGSLPMNSNLCCPPGMAPQDAIVSGAARLGLEVAHAHQSAPKQIVQNRIAEAIIKSTPAAAPPSGTNQCVNHDGTTGPRTGTINLAGMMYTPTASKKGESANATAPSATAAMIPTPTDEKSNLKEVGNFTSVSSAAIGTERHQPRFNFTVLARSVEVEL